MNTNVKTRSIGLCIVLTIVTCGIYGFIWMAFLTDDVNFMLNERDTSGGMCVLYSVITCGIYTFYWAYKMGEKVARIKAKRAEINGQNGYYDSSTPILNLVLCFVGLGIIVYALTQNEVNKAAEGRTY